MHIKGRGRLLVKSLLGLACIAYFLTSAVVVVNAFVWTPTLPSVWYQLQHILYWPFQPYFALATRLLGGASTPYSVYAVVTRVPFLVLSIVGAVALVRSGRVRRAGGQQRGN